MNGEAAPHGVLKPSQPSSRRRRLESPPYGTVLLILILGVVAVLNGWMLFVRGMAIARDLFQIHGLANMVLGAAAIASGLLLLKRSWDALPASFGAVCLLMLVNFLLPTIGEAGLYLTLVTLGVTGALIIKTETPT
jgi:hypothetical protein